MHRNDTYSMVTKEKLTKGCKNERDVEVEGGLGGERG